MRSGWGPGGLEIYCAYHDVFIVTPINGPGKGWSEKHII